VGGWLLQATTSISRLDGRTRRIRRASTGIVRPHAAVLLLREADVHRNRRLSALLAVASLSLRRRRDPFFRKRARRSDDLDREVRFPSRASVTFGEVLAAAVTFVDAATLEVVTPAHAAGAVNVVVTNPDEESATLFSAYSFEPFPRVAPSPRIPRTIGRH
jgi:hypothetical protein